MRGTLLVTFAFCTALFAADKPDFTGTWRAAEHGSADDAASISIEQKEQEIRLSSGTDETKIDCNTMGRECEAKVSGEPVKVSYWYNGPTLVQMVFQGKNREHVTEIRRTLSADGSRMTVQITELAPTAKSPQRLTYVREQAVAGAAKPAQ